MIAIAANDWAPKLGWDNEPDVVQAKSYVQGLAFAALPDGAGRELIFDMAMRIRDFGVSSDTAIALIVRYAETAIPKSDIQEICSNAYEVAAIAPGLLSVAPRQASEDSDDWMSAEEPDECSELAWMEGESAQDDGPAVWPKPIRYDAKQHAAKLAETFCEARPDKLISSDGVVFSLDGNRVWCALPDAELAAEIRASDPTLILDTGKIMGMVKAIHLAHFTKARPFDWINKPINAPNQNDLILAANGILDFASGDLLSHTGRLFTTGLPVWKYDPNATCPLWTEKLGEWLHPSFHPALQEFMGYCLTPDTSLEVLLAMIGATRGGKGSITRVLQALVGPAHHASRTLNDLSSDFGLEGTLDKRLIVIPDAHDTDTSRRSAAIERIKCIGGRDDLSINRKNLTIINAKVPAKLVLVANKHPKFLDESGALANRELLLVFNNSFVGREDRDLAAKLHAELPGIANWALEGLRRLRANGRKFTIGALGRAASRELAESQSPALRFASDCLIVTGNRDDYVSLDEVFASYANWADFAEGLGARERRNRNDFRADLIAALATRGVKFEQRRWHDPSKPRCRVAPRVRGFFGFKLKPDLHGDEGTTAGELFAASTNECHAPGDSSKAYSLVEVCTP